MLFSKSFVRKANQIRNQKWSATSMMVAYIAICIVLILSFETLSFSDKENKIGRPRNFIVTVREFEFAAGAGVVIPILGDMMRMPGLPVIPASEGMDIDNNGKISGLS